MSNIPLNLRLKSNAVAILTQTNVGTVINEPSQVDDTSRITTYDEDVFLMWQKELQSANQSFEIVNSD
jgi:hypothetical protein